MDPNVPDLRERRRRATRHEISLAALDLFEQRGVAATTVDEIAKAAGVSASTFFRHFKTKEESKLGALEHILQPDLYPTLYGDLYHKVRINYYPPRRDNKEGWDNIDIFGWMGYPMQIKVDFLCRDSILAAPIVLDLALFLDLASRAGMGGIQEWLSFYFKAPQTAPGLYPEHDIFIQHWKLKNTLRWMMDEDIVTHLGTEYYD